MPIDREQTLLQTLLSVISAVVASPTRVSGDPKVSAAIQAAILTRARLRLMPLEGVTPRWMCDQLIAYWTAERDALPVESR